MIDQPSKPSLFRLSADGRSLDLLFGHCAVCDGLTFASAAYGCAHCGAAPDHLSVVARPGEGKLHAFVTLHASIVPGVTPPQTIGEIEIAPGITEEALIGAPAEALAYGMTLVARAKPSDDPDGGFDCWFYPQAAA